MIHHIESQVLILLCVACVVGMIARRLRLPYTLALVVAGLLLAFVDIGPVAQLDLSADLLLLLLLPALLFEAAFHIEWKEFRAELPIVLTLALPGVAFGVAATGALLYLGLGASGLVPGFGWSHAMIFGAVIAATDPISVLALFKELGVTRRLYLLVEGESLLNDGVAVVAFFIVLAVFGVSWGGTPAPVLEGTGEIVAHGLRTFAWMALGGAGLGAVIGLTVSALTQRLDDHLLETTLTTLVAFGSFFLAETWHTSGVLATVVAGLVMGSVGAKHGMSPVTKRAVEDFWEYMAFLANSFIFLMVGLDLHPETLWQSAVGIVVAFVCVFAARAAAIYGLVPVANRFTQRTVPMGWRHVMAWGGLRGSLSMVLVLTLPAEFPGKQMLSSLVFGVVGLSLFAQGLTVEPLLKRLGLLKGSGRRGDYEMARAEVLATRKGIKRLQELRDEGVLDLAPYERLQKAYGARLEVAEKRATTSAGATDYDEQLVEGLRHAADVERQALRSAAHAGILSDETASSADVDILRRLDRLAHIDGSAVAVSEFVDALGQEERTSQD